MRPNQGEFSFRKDEDKFYAQILFDKDGLTFQDMFGIIDSIENENKSDYMPRDINREDCVFSEVLKKTKSNDHPGYDYSNVACLTVGITEEQYKELQQYCPQLETKN